MSGWSLEFGLFRKQFGTGALTEQWVFLHPTQLRDCSMDLPPLPGAPGGSLAASV